MDLFTNRDLQELLKDRTGPYVTLLQATHRGGAEEDVIRWRKHLNEAEKNLIESGCRRADAAELLSAGRELLDDTLFWKKQSNGIAVFLAPKFMRLYRLPVAFRDTVSVGRRFTLTPLLPLLSAQGRFYVLALSQNNVRLLQCTGERVSSVHLSKMPLNITEALTTHDRDEPLTFHTRPTSGGGWGAIFEGHGVGIDDAKDDLLRYFQQIDRGLHPLLREEKAPMLLAAVGYLQPLYRQANTYAHLLKQSIDGNPDKCSDVELHAQALRLIQPMFREAQQRALAQYQQAAGTGYTSADLETIVTAAHKGQIETLFVTANQPKFGTFDPTTGRVEQHHERSIADDDLIELAVANTLKHDHKVFVVDVDEMPAKSELAAIFCLPLTKHAKQTVSQ